MSRVMIGGMMSWPWTTNDLVQAIWIIRPARLVAIGYDKGRYHTQAIVVGSLLIHGSETDLVANFDPPR